MRRRILLTGGAGFIGSAVARSIIRDTEHHVIVFDKLTYAGNLQSLASIQADSRFAFVKGDICDTERVTATLDRFRPDAIMNLAAESHVDRSIDGPADFVQTNVVGTCTLLQAAVGYRQRLPPAQADAFRFLHVSTDEVFGSLSEVGLFRENCPYAPNSPYAASKAGSDHLVRAWHNTYGLATIVAHCSNNYGPYHFPEKLIPLTILNALEGSQLPVYGNGGNVRDWLFVVDNAEALLLAVDKGRPGATYNVGGNSERRNIDVVHSICDTLDELVPDRANGSRRRLIKFVQDRPGHDWRYATDSGKIARELGWKPTHSFDDGLRKTVTWYLENRHWWQAARSEIYAGARLGLVDDGPNGREEHVPDSFHAH